MRHVITLLELDDSSELLSNLLELEESSLVGSGESLSLSDEDDDDSDDDL